MEETCSKLSIIMVNTIFFNAIHDYLVCCCSKSNHKKTTDAKI